MRKSMELSKKQINQFVEEFYKYFTDCNFQVRNGAAEGNCT